MSIRLEVPIIKSKINNTFTEASFMKVINDENYALETATLNCVRGFYNSFTKSKGIEYVNESFSDFTDAIINFLKKLWNAFVNFIKRIKNYIVMIFSDFDSFLKKNKDKLAITKKEFKVMGYNYTIGEEKIDRIHIDNLITDYNKELDELKEMSKEDFAQYIKDQANEEYYDSIRGVMVNGSGSISSSSYEKELFKKYRDGQTEKSNIDVNAKEIVGFADNYSKFKSIYDKLEIEEKNVRRVFERLKYFFEHMPLITYSSSSSYIKTSKFDISDDKLRTEDSTTSYDKEYYLKLVGFYTKKKKMTKELTIIYTRAYMSKLKALSEALSFYKSNIKKCL